MLRFGLCIVVLALWSRETWADPHHVLQWTRGPGAEACIGAPALAGAVEARFGRGVFAIAGDVIIDARVQPSGSGWHVEIAVRGTDGVSLGTRELDEASSDCRVLDDALVLMIALIVDPDAAFGEPPPRRAPIAAEPWLRSAGVSLSSAGLLLPGLALGVAARVAIDPPGFPAVALRGTLWRDGETRVRDHGSSIGLATAGIALCAPIRIVELCAGFDGGRMVGDGFGFTQPQHAVAVVAFVTLEPRMRVALTSRVGLAATAGVWIPLVRPRFVFDQVGQAVLLYQPPPVAFVGQVGLDVRF